LPTEESAAVVGGFDSADGGSTATRSHSTVGGYDGVANNSSPAHASGSAGTPARSGSRLSRAARGLENSFDVLSDSELVEVLATQGLMGPDAIDPASPMGPAETPAVGSAPSALVNESGVATQGGPSNPEAALAFQIPEPIASLIPSLVVVDVGPVEDGGGLRWNASDPAAPGASAAFAGNILTSTDVPINDTAGNSAPAAGGGVSVGVAANEVAAVPEPTSLLLLGGGLVVARARQWKRRTHA